MSREEAAGRGGGEPPEVGWLGSAGDSFWGPGQFPAARLELTATRPEDAGQRLGGGGRAASRGSLGTRAG